MTDFYDYSSFYPVDGWASDDPPHWWDAAGDPDEAYERIRDRRDELAEMREVPS